MVVLMKKKDPRFDDTQIRNNYRLKKLERKRMNEKKQKMKASAEIGR